MKGMGTGMLGVVFFHILATCATGAPYTGRGFLLPLAQRHREFLGRAPIQTSFVKDYHSETEAKTAAALPSVPARRPNESPMDADSEGLGVIGDGAQQADDGRLQSAKGINEDLDAYIQASDTTDTDHQNLAKHFACKDGQTSWKEDPFPGWVGFPLARYRVTARHILQEYESAKGHMKQGMKDACKAILACKVDERVDMGNQTTSTSGNQGTVTDALMGPKILASCALFAEAMLALGVPYGSHFLVIDTKLWMSLLNSFSAGIILATGLIHIIPDTVGEEANIHWLGDYPLGMVFVVAGFLVVFFLETVLLNHDHYSEAARATPTMASVDPTPLLSGNLSDGQNLDGSVLSETIVIKGEGDISLGHNLGVVGGEVLAQTRWVGKRLKCLAALQDALLLLLAFCVHGMLEGIVIGLQVLSVDFWPLFLSVASHKFAAAIAITSQLFTEGATFIQIALGIMAFALIAPMGILLGLLLNGVSPLVSLILQGLAGGTFIYISAFEILQKEFGRNHQRTIPTGVRIGSCMFSKKQWDLVKFGAMVLGVLIIGSVALI